MPVGCLLAAECIAQCGDAAGGISAVTRGHPLGEIGDKSRDDRRKLTPHAEKSSFPRRVSIFRSFVLIFKTSVYINKSSVYSFKSFVFTLLTEQRNFSRRGGKFSPDFTGFAPCPCATIPGMWRAAPRFATRSRQDARRAGLAAAEITAARVAPRSLWEKYAASDENVFIYL